MMAVYALTVIITFAWILKMICRKEIFIKRSPFDIPLLLFLISQIISTIISIDRHVSIFGYYSRFNGGLLSVISYILLYYAFLSNINSEKIKKYLIVGLSSALLISLYGILEHFGIDKNIWIQDVQNRVFSTFGQPNWLAAYLAILIPATLGFLLNSKFHPPSGGPNIKQSPKSKHQYPNNKIESLNFGIWILYFGISLIFYITLIFTKSRSGFAAFWAVNALFWLILFLKYRKNILQILLIFNISLLSCSFIFGYTFSQLDRFTLSHLVEKPAPSVQTPTPTPSAGTSVLDTGITESGTIRRIVWKGAIDIIRHYPIFGSGVETFAYSYYKYRPVEHNMTSEWDFLYNKAHNEYLNYGATTGLVGLGTYLLFIASFVLWSLKEFLTEIRNQELEITNHKSKNKIHNSAFIIHTSLFCGWLSILITNFFGFSVVVTQIYFFLIPAITYLLTKNENKQILLSFSKNNQTDSPLNAYQLILIIFITLSSFYLIFTLTKFWFADVAFARGYNLSNAGSSGEAYQYLRTAIDLNPQEPLYFDEISLPAAEIAAAADEQKQATLSAQLRNEAIAATNLAITISPNNVNFWKTRTRVFYTLAILNPKYLDDSINALAKALDLSPTDPKVAYNLGLLYSKANNMGKAITYLKLATRLKPDYKDPHYALALFYKEENQKDLARGELEFILTRISTDDATAKKELEGLK